MDGWRDGFIQMDRWTDSYGWMDGFIHMVRWRDGYIQMGGWIHRWIYRTKGGKGFPPSVLCHPVMEKHEVGWLHMAQRKHIIDFTLPGYSLSCDGGELTGE